MLNRSYKIFFIIFLAILCTGTLQAQDTIPAKPLKSNTDVYTTYHVVFDSGLHYRLDSIQTNYKFQQLRLDSLGRIPKKKLYYQKMDSLYRPGKQRFYTDSIRVALFKSDSSHQQFRTISVRNKKHLDSLNCNTLSQKVMSDSLRQVLFTRKHLRFDSLQKMYAFRQFKADSLHNIRLYHSLGKMDSLTRLKYMRDTAYIKFKTEKLRDNLEKLKEDLQRHKSDTLRPRQVRKPLEITMDMPASKDLQVFVDDPGRKLIIKTWDEKKVRLTMDIDDDQDKNMDIKNKFEKNGIRYTGDENKISIQKAAAYNEPTYAYARSVAGRSTENKQPIPLFTAKKKSTLTICVPYGADLNIVSSGENLLLQDDVKSLKVILNHANLVMHNAEKADIQCSFGAVSAGVIDRADIRINNTKFVCKEIGRLTIRSEYSSVVFTKSANVQFNSTNDHYDIQQVADMKGEKKFGEINVNEIKNTFVLNGSGANVKISNVNELASLVSIDNKYGDIQIPVYNTKNYSLQILGKGNRMNEVPAKAYSVAGGTGYASYKPVSSFSASGGSTEGPFTSYHINCSSCAVSLQ